MSLKPTKELIVKWDKKLADSGFKDIEVRPDTDNGPGTLKTWALDDYHQNRSRPAVHTEAIQEYYQMAGKFIYDYKFANKKEKAIWELHSEGHSCQTIEKMLKKRNFKVYKTFINLTIMRLREVMLRDIR